MLQRICDHLVELVTIIQGVRQQCQGASSSLSNSVVSIVDQLEEKGDEERAADAGLDVAGKQTDNLQRWKDMRECFFLPRRECEKEKSHLSNQLPSLGMLVTDLLPALGKYLQKQSV